MADIWLASKEAKPLVLGFGGACGAPSADVQRLAIIVKRFLRAFNNLPRISKTSIERIPAFVQTLDECRDFNYDYDRLLQNTSNHFGKRKLGSNSPRLKYDLPRYVYTDQDIRKFEGRLNFQLQVMDTSSEGFSRSVEALRKPRSMIIRKRIFSLDEVRSPSQGSPDLARAKTHVYVFSLFYASWTTLKIHSRIPRKGAEDTFHTVHSIDIVNYIDNDSCKRLIICINDSKDTGVVHYREFFPQSAPGNLSDAKKTCDSVPASIIYPFTMHEKYTTKLSNKGEVSLVEPCGVQIVGAVFESLQQVNPKYSFQDESDMLGFQSVLREKHILHTLGVETIKSGRGNGDEAGAQNLKIWVDIDGQRTISFYGHEREPKSHFEFPMTYFKQPLDYSKKRAIKAVFKDEFRPKKAAFKIPRSLQRKASFKLLNSTLCNAYRH